MLPHIERQKTKMSVQLNDLYDELFKQRVIEAVIWGIPAVNFYLMYEAMVRDAGGRYNEIVYWSGLFDWKNQTLTPNPDVIYFMPFFNTKEMGPMVIEIPPADDGSITGTIMSAWQTPLEDVGPAGFDKGKGGKYLILPPEYQLKVSEAFIPLESETYQGYALLRSIPKSGSKEDVDRALIYGKRIKFYPLSGKPGDTKLVDAINVVFDSTIRYDVSFFETLNKIIQSEPWLERDRIMIDFLKTIGIEKRKSFYPDKEEQRALDDFVNLARDYLNSRYESDLFKKYYDEYQWFNPGLPSLVKSFGSSFKDLENYPVDDRGVPYFFAYSSIKHPGAGQFYLVTIRDKNGNFFDSKKTYKLNVPANVPVRQYWSATVYDRDTHALIPNVLRPSRSSQSPGILKNNDGSVDLYFGPSAPSGKETNWIPTAPNGNFEVMFRFYGPEKGLFEKTWKLPDIELYNKKGSNTLVVEN